MVKGESEGCWGGFIGVSSGRLRILEDTQLQCEFIRNLRSQGFQKFLFNRLPDPYQNHPLPGFYSEHLSTPGDFKLKGIYR